MVESHPQTHGWLPIHPKSGLLNMMMPACLSKRLLLVLVAGLTTAGRCPADKAPAEVGNTTTASDSNDPDLGIIPTVEERCVASGGQWRVALESCECTPGLLFSNRRGCFAWHPGDADKTTSVHDLGDLTISLGGQTEEPVKLGVVLAEQLQGVTVEAIAGHRTNTLLHLGDLGKRAIDQELGEARYWPMTGLVVHFNLKAMRTHSAADADLACRTMIVRQWPDLASAAQRLCSALRTSLDALQLDYFPTSPKFSRRVIGRDDDAVDLTVANLPASMGHGVYRGAGKGGAIFSRSLQFNDGNALQAYVIVSPVGEVMGGMTSRNHPLLAPAAALLRREVIYFDGTLQPVSLAEYNYGERAALLAAGRALSQERNRSPGRLATDGSQLPVYESVHGMFLESNVDLTVTALARRMFVEATSLDAFLGTGNLLQPLFLPGSDVARLALDTLCDDPRLDCAHSTATASLLAADLPNLRLSLMPTGNGSWTTQPAAARQVLIDKIRREKPRVVSISLDFSRDVGACEDLFDEVFRLFEEDVLFVVGAGNDGARNAQYVCPAGLASQHANVVAVAGVDEQGQLDPGSNYGAATVDVASAFCVDAVTENGDDGGKLTRQCGTSFAAPVVANAALRLFAQYPSLTATDVKQFMLKACTVDDLDVRCGGQLDIQQLELLVRSQISNPVPHPLDSPRRHPVSESRISE